MDVRICGDGELVRAVSNAYQANPHRQYVERLTDGVLKAQPVYIWGGAASIPAINYIHRVDLEPHDVDLAIDDSRKRVWNETLFSLPGMGRTRLGAPRWDPAKGISIDLTRYSHLAEENDFEGTPTINDFFDWELLTVNALGLDVRTGVLYDAGAIEAIESRMVDINNLFLGDRVYCACKALIKADKIGFTVGPRTRGYIDELVDPEAELVDHMLRMDRPQAVPLILRQLQKI